MKRNTPSNTANPVRGALEEGGGVPAGWGDHPLLELKITVWLPQWKERRWSFDELDTRTPDLGTVKTSDMSPHLFTQADVSCQVSKARRGCSEVCLGLFAHHHTPSGLVPGFRWSMDAWMGGVTGSQGKARESGPSRKDFPTSDSSQAHKPGPTLGPQHHRGPGPEGGREGCPGS